MSPPGPPIIRRSPTAGRVHCADSGSCLSATTYVAVVNGCVCEVGLSLFFFLALDDLALPACCGGDGSLGIELGTVWFG